MDSSQVRAYGAALTASAARVTPAAAQAVHGAAQALREAARAQAPVATGALRDSIQLSGSGLSVEVGTDLRYAPFVEYGTSRAGPQPFMAPAADTGEAALERGLAAVAERALPQ